MASTTLQEYKLDHSNLDVHSLKRGDPKIWCWGTAHPEGREEEGGLLIVCRGRGGARDGSVGQLKPGIERQPTRLG